MTPSDDARKAIAAIPLAPLDAIDKALAAMMPDGRTIAQHLDDGERLRAARDTLPSKP